MKRTLIKNARIVNEGQVFRGSVVIEGEKIAEVLQKDEKPSKPCDEQINANLKYLMPGIIDAHVHFREPGLTHKADIYTESRAAAAGGVTSFMEMPNTIPNTVTLENLEKKFELGAEKSLINYSFYFGATNDNAYLLPKLDSKRVCGVKLFMGSSTGNMLVNKMNSLLQIFNSTDLLIAAHCEDAGIIAENTKIYREKYGDDPDIIYHSDIRNAQACYASSALAVQLARSTGSRLHILHVSTRRELSLFDDAPIAEKRITAEACTAHLYFDQSDVRTYGSKIKCNPSIKSTINQKLLRAAVRSNLIDTIGTDHAPHLLSEKQGGCFKAASGIPIIQFSLLALMELVKKGVFTIEQLVQKMCHAPAELYEISNRGYIRKGYQADLVLLDPNYYITWGGIQQSDILSKCGWSPFEGHRFDARVERTFVNGHQVYDRGEFDDSYRGQELRFRDSKRSRKL